MQNKFSISERFHTIRSIGSGTLLVILGIIIGAVLFAGETPTVDEPSGYYTNLFTEMMGIAVTVFILNALARHREAARLKAELIAQAKSTANGVAVGAVDMLRHHGWLTGDQGALREDNLSGANLKNADLHEANLQGALLFLANLQGAGLQNANLQGARLQRADLRETQSGGANLQGADLKWANLQGAGLQNANLQRVQLQQADLRAGNLMGADLRGADLHGVDLRRARLDRATLEGANLQNTNFQGAGLRNTNLQGKNLRQTNFQGADLREANFQGTDLQEANLHGANLQGASLRGTHLRDANLQNAYIGLGDILGILKKTQFDENTILPDGTYWASDTDWTRFGAFTDGDTYKAWLKSQRQDEA